MLNISLNSVSKRINKSKFSAFNKLDQRSHSQLIIKVFFTFAIIVVACMFLPWTQNIRSKGYVTTLNPYDKPQNIQSLIGGRVSNWYVKEGDNVIAGDTIAIITESKEEYLDPDIINNTRVQQEAKLRSVDAYASKSNFLRDQLTSLKENRASKLEQLIIKEQQVDLKIKTATLDLEAAETYAANAQKQLTRMEEMYSKGIKSLVDLETKQLSLREALAKRNAVTNKLREQRNELDNIIQQRAMVKSEFDQKLAKVESEIQSTDSNRFTAEGETNKLQSKINQLSQRQDAYIIKAPITGRITKVLKNGIGEYIKAQESIATIVPDEFTKAVELYIDPNDMPLITEGKRVRLQFDGWPAVVFSGWPDNSFGTFGGKVAAIDNDISENGKYRILVTEDPSDKVWPDLIRIGSGARGLLLLNDVKIYYEIWRNLNGFPPDFYNPEQNDKIKSKAPLRKFK